MNPSPEAREWGKRQAARSPRWTDEKWNRVAVIFTITLSTQPDPQQEESADRQAPAPVREAA
ncbi:hypothetical protein [Actinomadura kijaniata]|uniref:hypothetical protein n=1 Tax=Actinomadura kijaniata TaxID=46161 RepID=UPI000AC3C418|nr:hypothetical protein [Actinomadura kijaniata]